MRRRAARRSTPRWPATALSSDAKHITEPDPTGPVRALEMALNDAGVGKDEIDYINAHATSTPVGDASETKMLKLALGEENARKTPVSGTKGATGHCLGAAGAIEATFTVLATRDGKLPPTINYESRIPSATSTTCRTSRAMQTSTPPSATASASADTTRALCSRNSLSIAPPTLSTSVSGWTSSSRCAARGVPGDGRCPFRGASRRC